jgi:hypothetical protein
VEEDNYQYTGPVNYNHYPEDDYPQAPVGLPIYSEWCRVTHSTGGLPNAVATAAFAGAPTFAEFENEFPRLGNPELPVYGYRDVFGRAVDENPITIVVGETGSGKSTQLPQMLVERGYRVIQSQPRRLAARMLAERMQSEIEGVIGEERAAGMVGYQTSEHSTLTSDTQISVITDGIQLLKQLNSEPADGEKRVYMLDEVHECNTNIEVSIAVIKRHIARHPESRFVLTSATMDAHSLAQYFADVTDEVPPVIEVPGRTHTIERLEEPRSTVFDEICKSATNDPDKDILVFLPGKREISDTMDALLRGLPEDIRNTATILPLHAKLGADTQAKVNQLTSGLKIILATNVAQTSLTIDGIEVVIDSGLERRVELDAGGIEGLRILPVSQADCDQRAGRTGRVGPGKYILTRYDKDIPHTMYEDRPKYPKAEILRSDIDRTTLRTASVGIDLAGLELFHKLDPASIARSKESLYNLGALDQYGQITDIGRKMDAFPVHPTRARMLMEALPYSERVRAQLAAIVSSMEVGGLQYFAPDVGKAWMELTDEDSSDLLAQLDLFIAVQDKTDAELAALDLDVQAVRHAQELYRKVMHRGNVGEVTLEAPSSEDRKALESAICAGLVNHVYTHVGDGNYRAIGGLGDAAIRELSRRSVVAGWPQLVVGRPYRIEAMRGGKPYAKDILEGITAVSHPKILGNVATEHLVTFQPQQLTWRRGVLSEVNAAVLFGSLELGTTTETDAPQTPGNVAYMRGSLLANPGPAQRDLRQIKRELEALADMANAPIPQLTQNDFLDLLDAAIQSAGELDQSRIDNALREIMALQGIMLDRFVSQAEIAAIYENAPPSITISGQMLPVAYRHGTPYVTRANLNLVPDCPPSLYLPDGREIMVRQGKRYVPIAAVSEPSYN